MPKWARRERPADVLLLKPARERITELVGSMLGGAVVAIILSLVMVILGSWRGGEAMAPQLWAWLTLVGIVGTWAVLIPSKLWEGRQGEAVLRRFVLLVVGLAVGVFAAGAASFLRVSLPYGSEQFLRLHNYGLPLDAFYHGSKPLALAYMAVFGTLFPTIRWWRQADPLRRTRLSLWSVFVSVLVACVVAALWLFPQAWLMMAACVISVSVQLASPWLPSRRRHGPKRLD
jgi:hypothetical protein